MRAVSLTGWWLPSCCSCPALPPTGQVILDAHPRRAARAGRLVPLSVKTAPSGPCSSVIRSGGVTRYRLSLDIIGTLPRISLECLREPDRTRASAYLSSACWDPQPFWAPPVPGPGVALVRFVRSPATRPHREGE